MRKRILVGVIWVLGLLALAIFLGLGLIFIGMGIQDYHHYHSRSLYEEVAGASLLFVFFVIAALMIWEIVQSVLRAKQNVLSQHSDDLIKKFCLLYLIYNLPVAVDDVSRVVDEPGR